MRKFLSIFLLAVPAMASAADIGHGKVVFARCASCHLVAANAKPTIGPNLFGLVGRRAGTQAGFNYSQSMKSVGFNWTEDQLDAFLTAPAQIVPGSRMPAQAMPNQTDREDVIAYLATLK